MNILKNLENDLQEMNNKYGLNLSIEDYKREFIKNNPGFIEFTFMNQRFGLAQIVLSAIELYQFDISTLIKEHQDANLDLLKSILCKQIIHFVHEKEEFKMVINIINLKNFVLANHVNGYMYVADEFHMHNKDKHIISLYKKMIKNILSKYDFETALKKIKQLVYIDVVFNEKYEIFYENEDKSIFIKIEDNDNFLESISYVTFMKVDKKAKEIKEEIPAEITVSMSEVKSEDLNDLIAKTVYERSQDKVENIKY